MLSTVSSLSTAGGDEPVLPDLAGEFFDAPESLEWGQTFRVDARIANTGDKTARSSTAKVYLSADATISKTDTYVGSISVRSIPRGGSVAVTKQLTLPRSPLAGFTQTDTVHIGMIVDAKNQVEELCEWNNQNVGTGSDRDEVQIHPRLPDLIGRSLDSQEPLKWGQPFKVTARIKNQGSASANASTVAFYLSADSVISQSDAYLGSVSVKTISPNAQRKVTARLELPSWVPTGFTPTGQVYVGMIVDAENQVVERNESNNANQGTGIDRDLVAVTPGQTTPNAYLVFEHWGGEFSDAEKVPGSDGEGETSGRPGTADDWMCWAAAASNVLAWTGWGNVPGMSNADDIFRYFQDHWTDQGGSAKWGWEWWFTGDDPSTEGSYVDVPGGRFHESVDFGDYYRGTYEDATIMTHLNEWLRAGYGTVVSVAQEGRRLGHAIAGWGVSYSPGNPDGFVGIWVTDSDDDKWVNSPPDRLRYYDVEYHDGRWYLQGFRGADTWYLNKLRALERMPTSPAPFEPFSGLSREGVATNDSQQAIGMLDGTSAFDSCAEALCAVSPQEVQPRLMDVDGGALTLGTAGSQPSHSIQPLATKILQESESPSGRRGDKLVIGHDTAHAKSIDNVFERSATGDWAILHFEDTLL